MKPKPATWSNNPSLDRTRSTQNVVLFKNKVGQELSAKTGNNRKRQQNLAGWNIEDGGTDLNVIGEGVPDVSNNVTASGARDTQLQSPVFQPPPPLKDIPIPLDKIDRLVDLAVDLTALHYHVRRNRVLQSGRGNLAVSRARQVCMYLLHTSLQFSYQEVAYLLCRDRSTVAHACRVVEDLREDPEFEVHVLAMERILYPLNRMVRDQSRNAEAGR